MNNSIKKNPIKSRFVDNPAPSAFNDVDNLAKLVSLIEQGNIGACKDFLLGKSLDLNAMVNDDIILNIIINVDPIKLSEAKKIELIDYLVKQKDVFINSYNDDGITPMHCAVKNGYENIVDYLIENKANVNVQSDNGLTPLHYATLLTIKECPKENMPKALIDKDRNIKTKTNDITKKLIKIFFEKNPDINNGDTDISLYGQFLTDMNATYNIYHTIANELLNELDISEGITKKLSSLENTDKNGIMRSLLEKLLKTAKEKIDYPDKLIESIDETEKIDDINYNFNNIVCRDGSYNKIITNMKEDFYRDIQRDVQNEFNNNFDLLDQHVTQIINEEFEELIEYKNSLGLPYSDAEIKKLIKYAVLHNNIERQMMNYYNKQIVSVTDISENRISKILSNDSISDDNPRLIHPDINAIINTQIGYDVSDNFNNIDTERNNNNIINIFDNSDNIVNYILYNRSNVPSKADQISHNDISQNVNGQVFISDTDRKFITPNLMMKIYNKIARYYNMDASGYKVALDTVTKTQYYTEFANAFITDISFNNIVEMNPELQYNPIVDINYNHIRIVQPPVDNNGIDDLHTHKIFHTLHQTLDNRLLDVFNRYFDSNLRNMLQIKVFMCRICISHNIKNVKSIIESSRDNLYNAFVSTLEKHIYEKCRGNRDVTRFSVLNIDDLSANLIQRIFTNEGLENIDLKKYDTYNAMTTIDEYFTNCIKNSKMDFPMSFYKQIHNYWSVQLKKPDISENMFRNYKKMDSNFTEDYLSMNITRSDAMLIISNFYAFLITFFKRYFYDNQHFSQRRNGITEEDIMASIYNCVSKCNFTEYNYNFGIPESNKIDDYMEKYDKYMQDYYNGEEYRDGFYPTIINSSNIIHVKLTGDWNINDNNNKVTIVGNLEGPVGARAQPDNTNSLILASEFINKALKLVYTNFNKKGLTLDFIKKLIINVNKQMENTSNYNGILSAIKNPVTAVFVPRAGANVPNPNNVLGGRIANDGYVDIPDENGAQVILAQQIGNIDIPANRDFFNKFRNRNTYIKEIYNKSIPIITTNITIKLHHIFKPVSKDGIDALSKNPFGTLFSNDGPGNNRVNMGQLYTEWLYEYVGAANNVPIVPHGNGNGAVEILGNNNAINPGNANFAVNITTNGGAQVQNFYESLFYIRYNHNIGYSYNDRNIINANVINANVNDIAIPTIVNIPTKQNMVDIDLRDLDTLQLHKLHNKYPDGNQLIMIRSNINHINLILNLMIELKKEIQIMYNASDFDDDIIKKFKKYYKYYHHLSLFAELYLMSDKNQTVEYYDEMTRVINVLQGETFDINVVKTEYDNITSRIITEQQNIVKKIFNFLYNYTESCLENMKKYDNFSIASQHIKTNYAIQYYKEQLDDLPKINNTIGMLENKGNNLLYSTKNIDINQYPIAIKDTYVELPRIPIIRTETKIEHYLELAKICLINEDPNSCDDVSTNIILKHITENMEDYKNDIDAKINEALIDYSRMIYKDYLIFRPGVNVDFSTNCISDNYIRDNVKISDILSKDLIRSIIGNKYKSVKNYKLLANTINKFDIDIGASYKEKSLNSHMYNIYEQFAKVYIDKNLTNIFVQVLNEKIMGNNIRNVDKLPTIMLEPEDYAINPNDIKSKLKDILSGKDTTAKYENIEGNIKLIEDEDHDIFNVEQDRINIGNNDTFIFYSYDYYNKQDEMKCVQLNTEIINKLINGHADIHATDMNGKTIIDYMIEGRMYYLLTDPGVKESCRMPQSINTLVNYELLHNKLLHGSNNLHKSFIDNHQTEFINKLKLSDNIKQNIPINLRYIFHAVITMQNIQWFRLLNKTYMAPGNENQNKWNTKYVEYTNIRSGKLDPIYNWITAITPNSVTIGKILGKEKNKMSKQLRKRDISFNKYSVNRDDQTRLDGVNYDLSTNVTINDIINPTIKSKNKIFDHLDNLFGAMATYRPVLTDPSLNVPTNYSYIWKHLAPTIEGELFMIHYQFINKYNDALDTLQKSNINDSYAQKDISACIFECENIKNLSQPISDNIDERLLPYIYADNELFKFQVQSIVHILSTFLGANMFMLIKRIIKTEIYKSSASDISDSEINIALESFRKYVTVTDCSEGYLSYDFLKAYMNFKRDDEDDFDPITTNKYFDKLSSKIENLEGLGITNDNRIIEKLNISIGKYYLALYTETASALINCLDGYYRLVKNQLLGMKFISEMKIPND